jgi:putative ABC transport system permease protein
MLRNYLTIAMRHLRHNRVFSFLNVMGLAIGLACCILISLYVWSELHYDTYPVNADNIYRVEIHLTTNGGMEIYPTVDIAVGEGITKAFSQVRGYTRFLAGGPGGYWTYGGKTFKETRIGFADSNFFSFFSLPLVEGNAATALSEPLSVVITRTLAKKYFGNEEALGQSIGTPVGPFKVTGVMEDMPGNSHFHFDGMISLSTLRPTGHTWSNAVYYTYLQLEKGADPKKIEAGMPRLVAKYVVPEVQHDLNISLADAEKSVNTFLFVLQPLRAIHLYGNSNAELERNGDIHYVYIFSALAIFILLLACVNFTNLSTAIAMRRGKEVGIRKVMGSLKRQLVSQFIAEALLLTFLALLVAMGLVAVLLPSFNQFAGKNFSFISLLNYRSLGVLVGLWLVTGFCAGSYPAFFLSSFNVIRVLKGVFVSSKGNGIPLRRGLVVFQFFVSISLMIATLIIYRQLHYMQDRKLGYDKDQVICLPDTYLPRAWDTRVPFRQELMHDPRVVDVSLGSEVPARDDPGGGLIYPKDKQSTGNEAQITAGVFHIDYDYIPTLGMRITGGRNFSRDFASDSTGTGVIINEAAVRALGWSQTDPIGKTIVGSNNDEYKVVGVVADFNYVSLKRQITPMILFFSRGPGTGMIIKVNTHDMAGFLKDLEQRWKALNPGAPFSYFFLDERLDRLYSGEQRTAQLFGVFACLAIVIACLGLFGLASFTAEQRAKEIGIRKVLGASIQQVLVLVTKEFLVLVGIAFLLAIPVTWWAMHSWLQDFAYRTSVSAWIFLVAGSATALIALLTVSSRVLGAALANPVKVLRSE